MRIIVTALLLTLTVVFTPCARAQIAVGEYEIKAAFLPNFAHFVEWPADVFAEPGSPFIIGVVGDNPFGGTLASVTHGQSLNGHPMQLRHLRWNEDLRMCQILYIPSSEAAHLPAILSGIDTSSVLTVSDLDRFSLQGGVIEFRMVGNRVRFDINWQSALRARLKISSKLLSVARAIHTVSVAGSR